MGPPKTVKSPLAAAVAEIYGKGIYIAADEGSEFLPSIPEKHAKNLTVVKPGPHFECAGEGCDGCGNRKYDRLEELMDLAGRNWKKELGADFLIWDSFSTTCEDLLQTIADSEFFSTAKGTDKHITIGEPGTASSFNLPMPGDYLSMQGIVANWRRLIFRQPIHLFVITHVDTDDKPGAGKRTRGGPSLVGKALIQDFPTHFNAVLRTNKTMVPGPDGNQMAQLTVYTEGDDFWIGGFRHKPSEDTPRNPIPVVEVGKDLAAFWRLFNKTFEKQLTAAPVGA
jgi:hypothetical protein